MGIIPDVYHGRTLSSWDDVKKSCDFIIFKATEGRTYIDPKVIERIQKAETRNIPYWVYCYLRKGNELDQAKFMVETVKNYIGVNFIGYVLDAEEQNNVSDCKKALEYLLTLDTKTMFYCMYADYSRYETLIKGFGDKTAFWEARYGLNNGTDTSAKYPPHKACDLLQYTDAGKIALVPKSTCDLNKVTGYGKKHNWFTTPYVSFEFPYYEKKGFYEKGDKGTQVELIQIICNKGVGACLDVDGIYGPATEAAVKEVQRMVALNEDGRYDHHVSERLLEYYYLK